MCHDDAAIMVNEVDDTPDMMPITIISLHVSGCASRALDGHGFKYTCPHTETKIVNGVIRDERNTTNAHPGF